MPGSARSVPGVHVRGAQFGVRLLGHEESIEHPLKLSSPFSQLPVPDAGGLSTPEELVRDVQGDEHRETDGVARRRHVGDGAHFLVDVAGQPHDVRRVEGRADGIAQAANLDRNDRSLI